MKYLNLSARLADMWQRIGLLLLGFFVLSALANATTAQERSAYDWLQTMQKASQEVNYRGVFMFSRGDMSSSVRVVHRFQDGMVEERLKQLDGAMGEIIRHGSEVMCVFPDNRVVQIEKDTFANKLVSALSGYMPDHNHYDLTVEEKTRLVDRHVVKLMITARDSHRYSYALWLDIETGLLLKSSILNKQGESLEHFQFSQIEFPETISDRELQPMNPGEKIEHEMIPAVTVDRAWPEAMYWKSEWVPPGFEKVTRSGSGAGNVMFFSDGLATYSVFVEPADADRMPEGASMVGATVAYSHSLKADGHAYGVTVMGEVPPMTAMMIAESIKPAMKQ